MSSGAHGPYASTLESYGYQQLSRAPSQYQVSAARSSCIVWPWSNGTFRSESSEAELPVMLHATVGTSECYSATASTSIALQGLALQTLHPAVRSPDVLSDLGTFRLHGRPLE